MKSLNSCVHNMKYTEILTCDFQSVIIYFTCIFYIS